ncbi:MAG: hypothetical protein NT049_17650, partial [Planctomycetota bacterium]|nr:hypothetical protein [Planctomycetota bacterium]
IFDVSVFAKVALTFDCQNGSQNRLRRGKYFQKNSPTVNKGGNPPSGLAGRLGIRNSGFGSTTRGE